MEPLTATLQDCLSSLDGDTSSLEYVRDIQGGIVNQAALFQSETKKYFVKYNKDKSLSSKGFNFNDQTELMFNSERISLQLLKRLNIIRVPESYRIASLPDNNGCIHVLEYIDELKPVQSYWPMMGDKIGRLHSFNGSLLSNRTKQESSVHKSNTSADDEEPIEPATRFGFDSPLFMGTFSPGAVWRDTWQEFFINDILVPLNQMLERKYGDRHITEVWSQIQLSLHKMFDGFTSPPELLHGDLCLANMGETPYEPVLFDPSCYYGDPEFGLTISHFEEAFPENFFTTYRKHCPKVDGSEQRLKAYKLFYYTIMYYFVDDTKLKKGLYLSLDEVKNCLDILKK